MLAGLKTITNSMNDFFGRGGLRSSSSNTKSQGQGNHSDSQNDDSSNEREETPSYALYLALVSLCNTRKDITDLRNAFVDHRCVYF